MRRRRRKRFIQLMFCDELYYSATVFDCCNTFATKYKSVSRCSKVATAGNTIFDDEPSLHHFIINQSGDRFEEP
jgi:hypothetical protein